MLFACFLGCKMIYLFMYFDDVRVKIDYYIEEVHR